MGNAGNHRCMDGASPGALVLVQHGSWTQVQNHHLDPKWHQPGKDCVMMTSGIEHQKGHKVWLEAKQQAVHCGAFKMCDCLTIVRLRNE